MIEEIQEITEAVEKLLEMSDSHKRGDTIPWAIIENIAGSRHENRPRHIIGRWRRKLLSDREIITLCATELGVRLLTHEQAAKEIPALRQGKAYRQVRRALKELRTVNDGQLTLNQRKMLSAQRSNMALQRLQLFRSRRQLAQGVMPSETIPRRRTIR